MLAVKRTFMQVVSILLLPVVERLDSGRDVGVTALIRLENPALTTSQLPDRLRGVEGELASEPPVGVGVEASLM